MGFWFKLLKVDVEKCLMAIMRITNYSSEVNKIFSLAVYFTTSTSKIGIGPQLVIR